MAKPIMKILIAASLLSLAGSGAVYAQSASEDRPVGHFSKLTVRGGIDVYLSQSTEESLEIEVEGIDLDDVVTEVDGDELTLSRKGQRGFSFFGDGEIKAYVTFVQLTAISASGGSDIRGRTDIEADRLSVDASGGSDVDLDVQAQSLEFRLSGGSDLNVSGRTQSVAIEASGGSDVLARSLEAEQASVKVSGGSDASIRASAAIAIDAHGGSDVSVYGNPAEKTFNNDRSSDVAWR
jgi:hypothetical protein